MFVDAYWNSREKSFHYHLFRLMSSWAVVVDIWFLDPQTIRPGEDGAAFATRIQRMIASRANLRPVTWDGYMKRVAAGRGGRASTQRSERAKAPAQAQQLTHPGPLAPPLRPLLIRRYWKPSPRFMKARQQSVAEELCWAMGVWFRARGTRRCASGTWPPASASAS